MNNEPVAWMVEISDDITFMLNVKGASKPDNSWDKVTPVYTHPTKTLTEIIEKNKPEIEKVNAYIKSLEDEIKALKAKTLTDEEIVNIGYHYGELGLNLEMIRAILKKASEK
jgi:hypothetical protein